MTDPKPKVTETETTFDVAYGDELTVIVPKSSANTKQAAINYSVTRWNEYKKQRKQAKKVKD